MVSGAKPPKRLRAFTHDKNVFKLPRAVSCKRPFTRDYRTSIETLSIKPKVNTVKATVIGFVEISKASLSMP